jgi:hypothetical protein
LSLVLYALTVWGLAGRHVRSLGLWWPDAMPWLFALERE